MLGRVRNRVTTIRKASNAFLEASFDKRSDDDDDDELLSKEQKSETHGEGCFNCSCIDDTYFAIIVSSQGTFLEHSTWSGVVRTLEIVRTLAIVRTEC